MKISLLFGFNLLVSEKYITEFIGIFEGLINTSDSFEYTNQSACAVCPGIMRSKTAEIFNDFSYLFVDTEELIDMHV